MKNVNTTKIVTGTVSQFNPERGFGIAIIDGNRPASISLTKDKGPFVVGSGEIMVFFTKAKGKNMPEVKGKVTIEVCEVPGPMGVPVLKAVRWCHNDEWEAQIQLVKNRDKTRPARSANFMRKFAGYFDKMANGGSPRTETDLATTPTKHQPKPLRTVIFSTTCHT